MERRTAAYGIPLRRPSEFPRRGLLAARVALIAAQEGWCPAFTKAAFLANFAEDQDIGQQSCLERLIDALGKNGQEVCKQAEAPENKAALRRQTEIAQQHGIFGAPSFLVDLELFWGDDRLEEAVAWARKSES
jgi:2-hydroxychromene-2-carboxylate isomerase